MSIGKLALIGVGALLVSKALAPKAGSAGDCNAFASPPGANQNWQRNGLGVVAQPNCHDVYRINVGVQQRDDYYRSCNQVL